MSITVCLRYDAKQSPNLGTKIALQKNKTRKENSRPQTEKSLGFVKRFSEFVKGIYETCDRNFFKTCVHYFLSKYFSLNDGPSKTMKNVFYFI